MPTTVNVDVAVYRDTEPVAEVNYRDRIALISALSHGFSVGNPKALSEPRPKKTAMEVRAKAKSWADLERKSIYFSIKCYPSRFAVKAWGRASDGTWGDEENTALEVDIPVADGLEAVADAIIEHLKTRRDLPGLMSASA